MELQSQSANIPLDNRWAYHYVDRLELKSNKLLPQVHTSFKPFTRKTVAISVDSLSQKTLFFTSIDRINNQYLQKDNSEWSLNGRRKAEKPILKHFYKNTIDFLFLDKDDFLLKLNPVFYYDIMTETGNLSGEELLFVNTRGLELRGLIGKKVGFYTFLSDNQARLPFFVRQNIYQPPALPGETRFTAFAGHPGAVDYFSARGYMSLAATQNIQVQFGHDKHFIGNGQRSMILSDFAGNYLFLKLQTNVWHFQYTNLFVQLTKQFDNIGDGLKDSKYAAIHHLSWNVSPRFNIGVFETVLFDRTEGYDLNYLNPIIFYRAVEGQLGSPDNVILGMDFKWNIKDHTSVYGQLVLDELNFTALRNQDGDWRNKNAFQLGVKTIDFLGVKALDFQLEFNQARPYTYTHYDAGANLTHYNQSLAHPLGANFREGIFVFRYKTRKEISIESKLIYAQFGTDIDSTNWGGNTLLDYNTRIKDTGNFIGQGIKNNLFSIQNVASWQWQHNMFLDLHYQLRINKKEETISSTYKSHIFGLGLRINIGRKEYLF